ncbi:ABC transporter substrate-binding protein [Aggregicoccus sp. 17bor-14]|uniref:MlaC/ttg2D family ABC transporter substrate-binding protein n=1 Tax=Myxococcaceae TaxID=31 RepID=UPI00129CF065|nr:MULTISPECIES: ABC transporter substrate-binding protein [Myxococcaceae]MBF5044568.1 ABC transporter substrate-binding protein [Simulacricoccus sp. 17bor-14]MRI90313.1 ABC transporter substrate-binding protein [Aggregicoccus sp. 17bor-14]
MSHSPSLSATRRTPSAARPRVLRASLLALGLMLLGRSAAAQTPAPAAAPAPSAPAAAAAPSAPGPETGATRALRDANVRLRKLLQAVPAGQAPDAKTSRAITEELRSLFDIEDLAKRALASHWGTMTPAQRKTLTETLRDVVEQNYLSQLRSNLNYEIKYEGEEARGADQLVHTRILAQRRGRPFEVRIDYLLHPQGQGFRAYDVVTDGVSILENYRSQFNRIIRKDGVDGLIKKMKARLARGSGESLTGGAGSGGSGSATPAPAGQR